MDSKSSSGSKRKTIDDLVRQLSSLSKHAENIFGEIYYDATVIHHKINALLQRVDQLDATSDQGSLNEAKTIDQHTLDMRTLSASIADYYKICDLPPKSDALNQFRDSPRCLYTNPSSFFDLWKEETLKDVADQPRRVRSPNDISKGPKKRRKQPQGTGPMGTTMYNDMPNRNRQISGTQINQQNEVFSFPEEYQAPQALGLQLNFKNQNLVSRATGYSQNSPTAEAPKVPAFLQGSQAQRLLFQKLAEQAKEKFERRKNDNN
ncbi:hypothetical protein B9Z55_003100 [Caenorhabditis nigoni]|nr:hypothetical protein B9Z55_003100 [Caenorhabditis nigoni]